MGPVPKKTKKGKLKDDAAHGDAGDVSRNDKPTWLADLTRMSSQPKKKAVKPKKTSSGFLLARNSTGTGALPTIP